LAFGKGWSLARFSGISSSRRCSRSSRSRTSGRQAPRARSRGVTRAQIATEADFARYRGKLAGKIVLTQPRAPCACSRADHPAHGRARDCRSRNDAVRRRAPAARQSAAFRQKLDEFYAAEGVVAVFDRGGNSDMAAGGSDMAWQQQHPDGGTIFPAGAAHATRTPARRCPNHARGRALQRMVRVLDKGLPVKVELNVETKFYDEGLPNGSIRSRTFRAATLASEVVILGAHFDRIPTRPARPTTQPAARR